jgi:hypothetical protein
LGLPQLPPRSRLGRSSQLPPHPHLRRKLVAACKSRTEALRKSKIGDTREHRNRQALGGCRSHLGSKPTLVEGLKELNLDAVWYEGCLELKSVFLIMRSLHIHHSGEDQGTESTGGYNEQRKSPLIPTGL